MARGLVGVVGGAILLAVAAIRLAVVLGRLRITTHLTKIAVGLPGHRLPAARSGRSHPSEWTGLRSPTRGAGGLTS